MVSAGEQMAGGVLQSSSRIFSQGGLRVWIYCVWIYCAVVGADGLVTSGEDCLA